GSRTAINCRRAGSSTPSARCGRAGIRMKMRSWQAAIVAPSPSSSRTASDRSPSPRSAPAPTVSRSSALPASRSAKLASSYRRTRRSSAASSSASDRQPPRRTVSRWKRFADPLVASTEGDSNERPSNGWLVARSNTLLEFSFGVLCLYHVEAPQPIAVAGFENALDRFCRERARALGGWDVVRELLHDAVDVDRLVGVGEEHPEDRLGDRRLPGDVV